MTVSQLIYYSQPFGFDDSMLNGILLQARRNNARDGLTGALIVRGDLYLQLLEGPEAPLLAAFARIKRDNRHLAIKQLSLASAPARMFPDWTMRDDPAQSWLWDERAVSDGALDRTSVPDLRGIFARIGESALA